MSNLLGNVLPLLVAIFTLPLLTRELGTDRFGVLTLSWVILGYFSLFDLGLGRAMTKLVAEKIGLGRDDAIPALIWTSLGIMLLVGLLGSIIALAISPWLVHHALRIPAALEVESLRSFYLLAISIPIVTTTAGLRGVLEARQRFDLVNAIRIPIGAFTFLGPAAVLPFSHSLVAVVAVLLAGRVVAWIAHLVLCRRVIPTLGSRPALQATALKPLLQFGGWISVSNIIGPLMVTLDRFIIGAMISVSAVAYYAAPYEIVTKLWVIPGALTGVLFPAFATASARDQDRGDRLFRQGVKYTFMLLFPVILLIVGMGREGLHLWLGPDYAQHSTRVLQWLAIGVLFNCVAQIPFVFIQAGGRPDITAKLHVVELPFYFSALWWLTRELGVEGAAITWTARCMVDTVALFILARSAVSSHPLPIRSLSLVGAITIGGFAVALLPLSLWVKAALLGAIIFAFGLFAWFSLMAPNERRKWRLYSRQQSESPSDSSALDT